MYKKIVFLRIILFLESIVNLIRTYSLQSILYNDYLFPSNL